MRKRYAFLFMLMGFTLYTQAQYNVRGAAAQTGPAEFLVTPAATYVAGAVWHKRQLNLNEDFEINTQLYFGAYDTAADGMAFVLQAMGTEALGNEGAGIGYHNISPSVVAEFDTYSNSDPAFDLGDPSGDHLGFMSYGNAYHNHPSAIVPPFDFGVSIEDDQWHHARFAWHAVSKTFTVTFLGKTYSFSHDIVNHIFWPTGGQVYWGFTAGTGHAGNNHRVRILSVLTGQQVQPLSLASTLTPASCLTGGSVSVDASGGAIPYTYLWSNGSTAKDLENVQPGTYSLTVTDAAGTTREATFAISRESDVVPPQLSCPSAPVNLYYNLSNLYAIPKLTAADNCGLPLTASYAVTGATTRSGKGHDASGLFLPGTSTVTWTVTDASGNTATCSVQVQVKKVTVSIPDVTAVGKGGKANTLYLGYGPSALTLEAIAAGGTAPYSYRWSGGSAGATLTVRPTKGGTYTYHVIVTDAKGAMALMIKTIRVVDVRCGDKNDKVMVCHQPSGYHKKWDALCISKSAVAEHLAHGDVLGSCSDDDGEDNDRNDDGYNWRSETKAGEPALEVALPGVRLHPNPSRGGFEIQLNNEQTGSAQVLVLNASGAVVEKRTVQLTGSAQRLQFNLSGQAPGVYLVKLVTAEGTQLHKVVIQR